ncbi:uncharacterized protein LOC133706848 [Rosa rugosa]|uniref:uncharacterized protein LOC133706848 n=1 Tax=Rosa rugosa TaxID=74645 RepID=UPI002B403F13|nr:uncharacterized protein LOC133706848 [Rosa rugosa]
MLQSWKFGEAGILDIWVFLFLLLAWSDCSRKDLRSDCSVKMSSQDALDEPQPEISDTNLQESESGINQLEYNGIRYDKLAPEDIIGVKFVTVEAAETFYYAYAKAMGFDVRKDDKRTSARTGRVTIRKWVCSAEGERLEKYI